MISRRYARTLFMFASSRNALEKVYEESMLLSERLSGIPRLRNALANRMLAPERKLEAVEAFAGGSISGEFSRFLGLVIENKREQHLLTILWSFQDMARVEMKRPLARLVTAAEVDEDTLRFITDEISAKVNLSVTLETEVDPTLVGGYVLYWDTYRLDASVKGRLSRIREALNENKH